MRHPHPHLHLHSHTEDDATPDEGRSEDGQIYIDRSKLDFNPDDGLYTGTTVTGTTEIPGPHPSDEHAPGPEHDTKPKRSRADPLSPRSGSINTTVQATPEGANHRSPSPGAVEGTYEIGSTVQLAVHEIAVN